MAAWMLGRDLDGGRWRQRVSGFWVVAGAVAVAAVVASAAGLAAASAPAFAAELAFARSAARPIARSSWTNRRRNRPPAAPAGGRRGAPRGGRACARPSQLLSPALSLLFCAWVAAQPHDA